MILSAFLIVLRSNLKMVGRPKRVAVSNKQFMHFYNGCLLCYIFGFNCNIRK
jgi:hypothetical protein